MKTSLFVEYQGLQVNEKDIVTKIKEIWLNDGNKIKDIKDLKLYVKPEDNACYYVANGNVAGKVDLY